QRRRPDDGVGAAPAEIVRHAGRTAEPCRLYGARRSPAGLSTGVRRAIGGQHRHIGLDQLPTASCTASSAMARAASRDFAAAMKRPLWQKLAPATPETASRSA